MYHSTGLTATQTNDLYTIVEEEYRATAEPVPFPPALGLFQSMIIALIYARTNQTEAEIGEARGWSQATISRAVTALTPLLKKVLTPEIPTAEDVDLSQTVVIDGSLLPCWSWRDHPELYSGKHHTTGYNIQVACTLSGHILWVSDPVDGCRHDSAALAASGLLHETNGRHKPPLHVGDRGYQGCGMITPIKKPIGRQLHETEVAFNKQINRIRWVVERANAHLKNWKILHTDYRRPLHSFATSITVAIGLYFFSRSE